MDGLKAGGGGKRCRFLSGGKVCLGLKAGAEKRWKFMSGGK